MRITGSCKAGEQPQSCSAAAFYPRHISLDGPPALGVSHAFSAFSNDSSLTAPGIEERKREDYKWVRLLVLRQHWSDIRDWAANSGKGK